MIVKSPFGNRPKRPVKVVARSSRAILISALLTTTPQAYATLVEMTTNKGVIKLDIDSTKAPLSVTNFLTYTNEDFYQNTIFHRVVRDFVIQGGGFGFDLQAKTTHAAIQNEAANGLKNVRGTVAMARTNDPNTATSQFFINLKDNTSLDSTSTSNPASNGYAVFGHVVEGMDVVDAIGAQTVLENLYSNVNSLFIDLPIDPVYIQTIKVYPTANAGADQPNVKAQSIVSLDGTFSAPGSKLITNYAWTQVDCANQPPVCPTVTLNGGDSAAPQFLAPTVDTPTDLVFQLIITNDDGKLSSADTVTVTVNPWSVAAGTPIANAGIDRTVEPGAGVTLDGTASTDPELQTLTYKWTQIGTPKVLLTPNGTIAQPLFNAPSPTVNIVFTFALVVKDTDNNESAPDTVNITVKRLNHAPVAAIKGNAQVRNRTTQTLDGTGSSDQDNDAIATYQWTQTAGPSVDFDHAAAMPSFVVPDSAIGKDLKFSLVVSDGSLSSTAQSFTMSVTSTNHAPTVQLGLDRTVIENTPVTLNAQAQDADGDCLAYHWERIDNGTVPIALGSIDGSSLSFTAPTVSIDPMPLEFKLTVTDIIATNPPPNCNDTPTPKTTTDTVRVIVTPNPTVLDCTQATASPAVLWPPKGGMTNIRINGITGPNSAVAQRRKYDLKFTSITQDEPVKNPALGDTSSPDARLVIARRSLKTPLAKDSLYLRAQRQGTQTGSQPFSGNGRVYKVNFSASDGNEQCDGSVTVSVPPNATGTAVDDGQEYDAKSK